MMKNIEARICRIEARIGGERHDLSLLSDEELKKRLAALERGEWKPGPSMLDDGKYDSWTDEELQARLDELQRKRRGEV